MTPERLIFPDDVRDLLSLLRKHDVEYVIIGGQAVIYHGYPRFTGDTDLFVRKTAANARKLFRALEEFWGGKIPGIERPGDLLEGMGVQFGVYPYRIDLIHEIGLDFDRVWKNKVIAETAGGPVFLIGLRDLIDAKETAGRPQDRADAEILRKKLDL